MTVTSPTRSVTYNGNSIATVFPYPFRIFDAADLVVTAISAAGVETLLTITTDYTVDGVDAGGGGNVTMLSTPATGTQLRIERVIAETQDVEFRTQGPTRAEALETALDRLTMLVQQRVSDADLAAEIATAIAGLTAGTYNPVTATGGTSARSLANRFASSWSPEDFGAVGDGVADDTAAIQAAIDACEAQGYGDVYFIGTKYRCTAEITIDGAGIALHGGGRFRSRVMKRHTGNLFKITGNYCTFDHMHLEADTAADVTYGTTGAGIKFVASSAYGFSWVGGMTYNIDHVLDFATDSAHASQFTALDFTPYTIAPGSEPDAIYLRGDTTAAFRFFTAVFIPGNFRLDGALDTFVVACGIRTIVSDDNVAILAVGSTVFANNNNSHTFKGTSLLFSGCRFSGSVTLAASSQGTWTANQFTFGSLTDSSGAYLWAIHHRVESSALVSMLDGHLLRRGFAGILMPNAVVSAGNAAVSTQTTATPTKRTILFNTAITADRAVTLNTGADYKDGDSYHIIRTAAATGGFNVNVGAGPLKALAAGTWCIVTYDGSTWFLTAYGSL